MRVFIPYFSFDFVFPKCDVIKNGTVDPTTDQFLDMRKFQFGKTAKCHGINVSTLTCVVRKKTTGEEVSEVTN